MFWRRPTHPADAVVMLTHFWNPQLAAHYGRLKREAGRVHPVFLAFHQNEGKAVPSGMRPDIVVTFEDAARVAPARYAEHVANAPERFTDAIDVVWLAVFTDTKLAKFDRVWLIEYDVEFSGDWATLFRAAHAYDADLLATRFFDRAKIPDWPHWARFGHADDFVGEPLAAFLPIARYSRRMIAAMRESATGTRFHGHLEAVIPTIAVERGLSIIDLIDGGHYGPDPKRPDKLTHRFMPVVSTRYGWWRKDKDAVPNMIYHPVKLTKPKPKDASKP